MLINQVSVFRSMDGCKLEKIESGTFQAMKKLSLM